MTKDNQIVFEKLGEMHPEAECALEFGTPYQLLVAVMLSAQCTDERVNKTTPSLFAVAPTPETMVELGQQKLETLIYSCGFYHNKAAAILDMSRSVIALGGVPKTRDELMRLRGVGRKTANVVCAVAYGGNNIAVDTHVFRVANRLGIAEGKTPIEVEEGLMRAFDEDKWSKLHHYLIFHGRYVCHSQNPDCTKCLLQNECKYYKNAQKLEKSAVKNGKKG